MSRIRAMIHISNHIANLHIYRFSDIINYFFFCKAAFINHCYHAKFRMRVLMRVIIIISLLYSANVILYSRHNPKLS